MASNAINVGFKFITNVWKSISSDQKVSNRNDPFILMNKSLRKKITKVF